MRRPAIDAFKKLQGSYALLAISEGTRRVVAVRKDLPLVIGLVEGGTVFASDASVLQRLAHKALHLSNYDVRRSLQERSGLEQSDERCKRIAGVRTKTFKFRRSV